MKIIASYKILYYPPVRAGDAYNSTSKPIIAEVTTTAGDVLVSSEYMSRTTLLPTTIVISIKKSTYD